MYKVLVDIGNDELGVEYKAGDVVTLGPPWAVDAFLAIKAIEPIEQDEGLEEVTDGDGEDA